MTIVPDDCRHLGSAAAPAANEAGQTICAELFSVLLTGPFAIGAEIAEAVWVVPQAARCLPLAPLTNDYVLALADDL